jgi:hypothetical protein
MHRRQKRNGSFWIAGINSARQSLNKFSPFSFSQKKKTIGPEWLRFCATFSLFIP